MNFGGNCTDLRIGSKFTFHTFSEIHEALDPDLYFPRHVVQKKWTNLVQQYKVNIYHGKNNSN